MPVDAGNDGSGFAGDVEQDGRSGASVHGPIIHAGHHDQCGLGRHLKGQRNEQSDRADRAETRQDPDDRTEDRSDGYGNQVHGLQGRNQAVQKQRKAAHRTFSSIIESPPHPPLSPESGGEDKGEGV